MVAEVCLWKRSQYYFGKCTRTPVFVMVFVLCWRLRDALFETGWGVTTFAALNTQLRRDWTIEILGTANGK